jgi:hypothetical protein
MPGQHRQRGGLAPEAAVEAVQVLSDASVVSIERATFSPLSLRQFTANLDCHLKPSTTMTPMQWAVCTTHRLAAINPLKLRFGRGVDVNHREQKRSALLRSSRVLDAGREDKDVSGRQCIVTSRCTELDLSIEKMDGHWAVSAMDRQNAARGDAHDGKAERSLFDQRPCRAPVPSQKLRVDEPFILREVMNEHITIQSAMHGRHAISVGIRHFSQDQNGVVAPRSGVVTA